MKVVQGPPSVTSTPWTKPELWAITKEFPDPKYNPISFAKEFNLVMQTYQLGYSSLYQLIHMLIGEGRAKEWMDIVN